MISVLTVNYFSSSDLATLADSLRKYAGAQEVELIIANNSTEDAIDIPSDESLTVSVLPSANIGFAAGINLAYRHARGGVLFVANPDLRIVENTLDTAAAFLSDHADVGIALPLLRYPRGDVQPSVRRFYTWPVVLYARSPLRALSRRPAFFREYLCENLDQTRPSDVDWGLGGAMFLRRSDVDESGIFDERFFLYFEDVDLCYRMWDRRRRVVYCPQIACIHAHRRHSSNPVSRAGWHHFRSLLRFIAKYHGLPRRPSAA